MIGQCTRTGTLYSWFSLGLGLPACGLGASHRLWDWAFFLGLRFLGFAESQEGSCASSLHTYSCSFDSIGSTTGLGQTLHGDHDVALHNLVVAKSLVVFDTWNWHQQQQQHTHTVPPQKGRDINRWVPDWSLCHERLHLPFPSVRLWILQLMWSPRLW